MFQPKWYRSSLAALALLAMTPFVSPALWQAPSPAQKIEFDKPLERQIESSDVHQYKLALLQGQVISVALDEWSFNAKLELLNATDNRTLVTADLGAGMERETLTFLAEQSGDYLVRVSAGENESGRGRYRLTARLIGAATDKEQARIKAEQLLTEAAALNKEGTPDKIREAIGRGEQALALWRSLGDRYWESLTLARLATAYKGLLNSLKALEYFNQSLAITREFGDRKMEALQLIELGAMMAGTGERQKANEYFDQALQLFKSADNKLGMAMSLYWLGDNTNQLGDKPKALDYFNQALPLTREEQHKSWEASVLYGLGLVAKAQNDKPKALDLFNQALALWRAANYKAGEGLALLNIGQVYVSQDEAQKALDAFNQALPLFRSAKNKWQEAATFREISNAYQRLGKGEDSIAANKQQLAIYQELKVRVMEILLLNGISGQYQGLGKYAEAIQYADITLATEEVVPEGTTKPQKKSFEHIMQQSKAFSLQNKGMAYHNSGDPEKALLYYHKAFDWFSKDEEKNSRLLAVKILDAIAQVHSSRYEWEQALESSNRALSMAKEIDSKADIAQILNSLGMTYSAINEKKKALEYFEQSLAVNRSVANRSAAEKRFEAGTLDNIGGVYLFLGEPQKALDYHQQAVAVYKAINLPMYMDELATGYGEIGNVHRSLGENRKALEMYEQGLELFRQAPPYIKSLARNRTKEANFLSSIAAIHYELGETRQALGEHNQVLKMAIEAGDKKLEALTRNNIGLIHWFFGESEKALEYMNQARAFLKAINNKNEEATLLNNIAHVYSQLGENQKALEYYNQILPLFRAVGNRQGEAKTLNNIGWIRSSLGEKQTALEYLNQALSIFRSINSKSEEATTLNNIGLVYSELGESQKAIEDINEALALSRATGSRDREATTLDNLGNIYSGLGENRKALEYHNQALPIRRAIGDKHGEAATLNNIGTLYSDWGEKRRALDYYNQSLLIARAIGHRLGEAVALNNIGSAYRDLGEKQKALQYYDQALSLRRAVGDRSGEGTTLNSIGMVHLLLNDNEKAADHFNRALKIARQVGDKASEASYLQNLAVLFSDTGERGKALAYFDQALAIDRAIGSKAGEATILSNMAWDYYQLGENQKSLEYREECLRLSRETGGKLGQATALLGIGSIYRELGEQEKNPGRLKQSLDSYEQALQLSRQTENKDTEASALSGIGRVFTAMGETEKAAQNLSASLQLAQTYQNRSQEAATRLALGHLFEKGRALDKAVAAYQQAFLISRAIADRDGEAKALKDLMSAWRARGNSPLAIAYGKQAVNAYQQLRSAIRTLERKTQEVYREKVTDVYRELANLLIEQGRLPEAEHVLALLKDAEYKQLNVRRRGENPDTIPYSRAEAAVMANIEDLATLRLQERELQKDSSHLSPDQTLKLEQIKHSIKIANAAFETALDRLGHSEASVENRVTEIKTQHQMQSALDVLSETGRTGVAALYTVIGSEKENGKAHQVRSKFGWVVLVTSKDRKAYPIDVNGLEETVSRFRAALSSDKYDPQPLAEKLYNAIFRQTSAKQKTTLEADLQQLLGKYPNKTLMWSLDGVLRYVPIAALQDGSQYLVEKYRNVMFTNNGVISLKDLSRTHWQVLGLGVSEGRENLNALPGVERELADIVRQANETTGILDGIRKLNRDFTKQALFDLADSDYQVAHIATHYNFNPVDQSNSFLLLGDGKLTFADMKGENNLFGKLDLLALSACDTATASANGEETEGFAYLAQGLGAKSVIASLWKVSDAGTPELMIRFYKLRADNPTLSKGEAFRQAQLALLAAEPMGQRKTPTVRSVRVVDSSGQGGELPLFVKDTNKPLTHPHYWASFILIGNWR